jgi:CDP-diacylglycerol--glycerol-3-phosphate 3-phosphatidyltransferase
VIKARFGADLDGRIQRLFPFLFRYPIHPNWLSLVGLLISLAAGLAFAEGALRGGALLVLLGGFFDLVDGVVARHQGTSSAFGAFLDSSLDRVADMAILIGMLMHYAGTGQPALAWLAAFALLATVMVSYTKARAESVVPDFKGGLLERAERLLILVAGALLGVLPVALAAVALGSAITAGQRIALAHRRMSELEAPIPAAVGAAPDEGSQS